MPITRTPIVDDSGSGMDGTVLDNAWKTELYNQIDAAVGSATYVASTQTGTVHDWNPGLGVVTLIMWSGASDLTVTGLAAIPVGARITLVNVGTAVLYCHHNHAGSAVGNKLWNSAKSGPTPIAAGGWATYVYNGSIWLLCSHEQGAGITPTFSAADYAGNGSMTWTVGSVINTYILRGHQITVSLYIATSTVGGTPSNTLILRNGAWGGYTAAGTLFKAGPTVTEAGAGFANGYMVATGAGLSVPTTQLSLVKTGFANWTAGTLGVGLSLTFEVQ